MNNNIGQIIEEAFNIPEVKVKCAIEPNLTFEERQKREKTIAQVINYCILFINTNGLKEYIYTKDKEKFLIKQIVYLLNIDENDIELKLDEIFKFVCERFIINGFIFHSTNSFFGQQMKENGLSENNPNKELFNHDIVLIDGIFKKYSNSSPLGWGISDINNGRNGWFYDGHPKNITYYCAGPEWFNSFCGGSSHYHGLVDQNKRHGYSNRNYNDALECINTLIKELNMTMDDANIILNFFNKYWTIFEKTTPTLVMIPSKLVDFNEIEMMSFLKKYYLTNDDKLRVIRDIAEGGSLFSRNDQCCYESIPSESLSFVDLSNIIIRQNTITETNNLANCISLLQNLDKNKLQQAFEMLKKLEQDSQIEKQNNQLDNGENYGTK